MIREATLELGTDFSLEKNLTDRKQYRFRRDRFRRDKFLQSKVPQTFLQSMIDCVRGAGMVPERVSTEALEEFITLDAVAHIANFIWYRRLSGMLPEECGYPLLMPNCTRQALLRINALLYKDIHETVRELAMPSILGPILEAKKGPDVRIATLKLLQKKAGDSYKWLRECVTQVVCLLTEERTEDRTGQLKKIVKEIEKNLERMGQLTSGTCGRVWLHCQDV